MIAGDGGKLSPREANRASGAFREAIGRPDEAAFQALAAQLEPTRRARLAGTLELLCHKAGRGSPGRAASGDVSGPGYPSGPVIGFSACC